MIWRWRSASPPGAELVQPARRRELRLELRPDGHVYPVETDEPGLEVPSCQVDVNPPESPEDQEQVAANRARIEELHRERIGAVNDLSDVLGRWRVVLPVICVVGAVAVGITRVLTPVVWLAISLLLFAALLLVVVELQRKGRRT